MQAKNAPKVSVVCITYNQERYVKQALDGFVMQQTNFDFEVLIADDCSTDRTPGIIAEYALRYPRIIKPLSRTKNLGALPNLYDAIRSCSGKYIALCEGDDYWTDVNKLQIQSDFLDAHRSYALCFHPVTVKYEDGGNDEIFPSPRAGNRFSVADLLRANFIQTNSVMYRRQRYDDLAEGILPGDLYMHLYHAQFGKIGFINRIMSVYRRHPGGMWWESSNSRKIWNKHGRSLIKLYVQLDTMFGSVQEYRAVTTNALCAAFGMLAEVESEYHSGLLYEVIADYPDAAQRYIMQIRDTLQQKDQEIAHVTHDVTLLNSQLADAHGDIAAYRSELRSIKSSLPYRVYRKIRPLYRRKKHTTT